MNLLFLICTLSSLSFSAPDGQIKGKVVDSKTREPLIGVSVVFVDNPATGTVTDVNGDFVLPADDGHEVLKGDKEGISSIRVNDQYRIEFTVKNVASESIVTICNILELSNHYK